MVYVILEEFVKGHRDDGSVWEREREKNLYWWQFIKSPKRGIFSRITEVSAHSGVYHIARTL